jgi:hypothetical protein
MFDDFGSFAAKGLLDSWNTDRKSKSPKVSKPAPNRNANGAPPQLAELKFKLPKNEVVRQAC